MLYNIGFQKDGSYVVGGDPDIATLSNLVSSFDEVDTISFSCSKIFELIYKAVQISAGRVVATSGIKINSEIIPECVTDSLNCLTIQDCSSYKSCFQCSSLNYF